MSLEILSKFPFDNSLGLTDCKILQNALNTFVHEKIVILQREENQQTYVANFHSPKTSGLFQYYRAVLDENLSNLEYNKVDLK